MWNTLFDCTKKNARSAAPGILFIAGIYLVIWKERVMGAAM